MNKWKNVLIFFFAVALQKAGSLLYWEQQEGRSNLALGGVPVCMDIRLTCSKLILWYLPLSVLFFACSGHGKELTGGYAILRITRGERRGKVARDRLLIAAAEAVCLLFVNVLAMQSGAMKWSMFLTAFLLSALTILFFVFLEFLLELYLDSMASACAIQLLFVVLVFLEDMTSGGALENSCHYVFLPGFAFAERNGVYRGDAIMIGYELGILFLGICAEIILIRRKYQRQDLI